MDVTNHAPFSIRIVGSESRRYDGVYYMWCKKTTRIVGRK